MFDCYVAMSLSGGNVDYTWIAGLPNVDGGRLYTMASNYSSSSSKHVCSAVQSNEMHC